MSTATAAMPPKPSKRPKAAATDRANRRTPAAVLAALRPTAAPVAAPQPAVDRLAVGGAAPARAGAEVEVEAAVAEARTR